MCVCVYIYIYIYTYTYTVVVKNWLKIKINLLLNFYIKEISLSSVFLFMVCIMDMVHLTGHVCHHLSY